MDKDFDVLEINYSQLIGRWDIKDIDDRTKLVHQVLDNAEIEDVARLRERLNKVYLKFGEQSMADFWSRALSYWSGSFTSLYDWAVEFSEEFAQSISDKRAEIDGYHDKERASKSKGLFK